MDTHLKERLVGAAVLVAAAVILIPEMLSGPGETASPVADAERSAADSGIRTFTIDLANRGQASAPVPDEPVAEVVEAPAPPPETEEPPAEAAPQPMVAERPPVASEPAPVAPPAVVPAEPPRQAATPPASPDRNLSGNMPWVVQVGSFASQATAGRLSAELRQRGYASFVVPFKTATQTLYRVRIGPMQERGAADAAVQKLKREGTAAAVVANS